MYVHTLWRESKVTEFLLNIPIDIAFVTMGKDDADKHVDQGKGRANEASCRFQHPK